VEKFVEKRYPTEQRTGKIRCPSYKERMSGDLLKCHLNNGREDSTGGIDDSTKK
jgi:hypothetical protein